MPFDAMQGLGMLGGLLSLPRSVQYQQMAADQTRAQLAGLYTPEEIDTMVPKPGLGWASARRPGIGGKILGGVGDVGVLLSSMLGRPVGPPRASITDLANLSKLRTEKNKQNLSRSLAARIRAGTSKEDIGAGLLEIDSPDAAGRFLRDPSHAWQGAPNERTALTMNEEREQRAKRAPALRAAGWTEPQIAGWVESGQQPSQSQPPVAPDESKRLGLQAEYDWRLKNAPNLGLTPGTPEYFRYLRGGGEPPASMSGNPEKSLDDFVVAEKQRWERDNPGMPFSVEAQREVASAAQTTYQFYLNTIGKKPPGAAAAAGPPAKAPPPAEAPPPVKPDPTQKAPPVVEPPPIPADAAAAPPPPPPPPAPPRANAPVAQSTPSSVAAAPPGPPSSVQGAPPGPDQQPVGPPAPYQPPPDPKLQIVDMLSKGIPPRNIAIWAPEAWAAAGLQGAEGLSIDEMYTALNAAPPVPTTSTTSTTGAPTTSTTLPPTSRADRLQAGSTPDLETWQPTPTQAAALAQLNARASAEGWPRERVLQEARTIRQTVQ